MRNDPFDLKSRPPVIGRIVTATIALVCVLIVYDGWRPWSRSTGRSPLLRCGACRQAVAAGS